MGKSHGVEGLTFARLRAVLAVADRGSFSAAAAAVGLSQSSVSRSVADVEAILQTTIFDRSTRSVRVTEAGREIIERFALVVSELDSVVRSVGPAAVSQPRLVIASLTSVSELHLAAAVSGLAEPLRRVRCIEGLQTAVEQAVLAGHATVGIGDLAHPPPGLHCRPLWSEPFHLIVPTGHRLARRRRVSLGDIGDEPLVGFSRDAELRTTLDRELAGTRQLRTPEFIVDRYQTALSLVGARLGVMVAPAIVAAAIPSGLRSLELDHPDLRRTMGLLSLRPGADVRADMAPLIDGLVNAVARVAGVERLDRTGRPSSVGSALA